MLYTSIKQHNGLVWAYALLPVYAEGYTLWLHNFKVKAHSMLHTNDYNHGVLLHLYSSQHRMTFPC